MTWMSRLALSAAVVSAASSAPAVRAGNPSAHPPSEPIRAATLRGDVRFLASDLLEGRGPGTRGDELAQAYIAARMEAIGLLPGAPDGSYIQKVDLLRVTTDPLPPLRASRGAERLEFRPQDDYVALPGGPLAKASLARAEVVFVGYGIVAPEYKWDDFKGQDMRGKLLLIMNNDPENDPALFEGRRRLYYGRWDYKYEMAGRVGAAGALIIHTTPSAAYPWQVVRTSFSTARFDLPEQGELEPPVTGWLTEDASRRVVALGGRDLDQLRAAAERSDFRPVALGVTVDLELQSRVERVPTANIIGRLPGSDSVLAREALLYTTHHDHLGKREGGAPGEDTIYNGALDNASGVAGMLAIAQAMADQTVAPKRSVYFAAVAAEEQGLLGSKYLAAHPPIPVARIVADLNLDAMNLVGRTRDVAVIGLGKSSLDEQLRAVAASQGRRVEDDLFPERGSFYRSDQFSLARVGVPALQATGGNEVVGRPEGWGRLARERYVEKDYHQVSDEIHADWDWEGAVEDATFLLLVGRRVADLPTAPSWRKGDEFEAVRLRSLAASSAR